MSPMYLFVEQCDALNIFSSFCFCQIAVKIIDGLKIYKIKTIAS